MNATPQREDRHLLIFDGHCPMCSAAVRFVLRFDRRGVFEFCPMGTNTAREILAPDGIDPERLNTLVVVENWRTPGRRAHIRSDGALRILALVGGPWAALAALRVIPRSIRDPAYNLIARSRYWFGGRRTVCFAPAAEHRHRFLGA